MVVAQQLYETKIRESSDVCPRCSARMRHSYGSEEPACWMCGYVDYSYTPRSESPKSFLATGTHYLVRYIGSFPAMRDRLVYIQAVRGNGVAKIKHNAICPFCGLAMEAVALSIKRKQVSEDRYICPDGHRISLLQGRNGEVGWK